MCKMTMTIRIRYFCGDTLQRAPLTGREPHWQRRVSGQLIMTLWLSLSFTQVSILTVMIGINLQQDDRVDQSCRSQLTMGYESAEESLLDLSPLREQVMRVTRRRGCFSGATTSSSIRTLSDPGAKNLEFVFCLAQLDRNNLRFKRFTQLELASKSFCQGCQFFALFHVKH